MSWRPVATVASAFVLTAAATAYFVLARASFLARTPGSVSATVLGVLAVVAAATLSWSRFRQRPPMIIRIMVIVSLLLGALALGLAMLSNNAR